MRADAGWHTHKKKTISDSVVLCSRHAKRNHINETTFETKVWALLHLRLPDPESVASSHVQARDPCRDPEWVAQPAPQAPQAVDQATGLQD